MVKTSNLYNIIKQLCDKTNTTIAQLERNLSFSEGSISKWKHSNPSWNKVITVALHFNISLDFLAGRTEIKHMSEIVLNDADIISVQTAKEHMTNEEIEKMMKLLKLSFPDKF
jgi:transcriptional regulator with XRE-family HTH domain